MFSRLLLILIVWSDVISFCVQADATIDDLLRLRKSLFENYTRDVRPSYYLHDSINVNIRLFLLDILDIDEVSGAITMNIGMDQQWIDYRLTWEPSDFGGITDFLLNSTNVWKPRVYLVTSVDDLEDFGSDTFDVRLIYTGETNTSPGRKIRTTCKMDMTNFPSDSHVCKMSLYPWMFQASEVRLVFTDTQIYMGYHTSNGEWDVDWSRVANNTEYGQSGSMLDVTLHVTRRSAYYIISIVVPIFILCFLNPFVFLLPASSGERMSYIITMFLSLAVYMMIIEASMPKVSEPMAGISYFLLLAFCYSGLLVTLTIFTLRCDAVGDVNIYPGCLVRIVQRTKHPGICKVRQKVDAMERYNGGNEDEHAEPTNDSSDVEEPRFTIEKIDVMNFVDRGLFATTFGVMVVTVLGFTIYCWR